MHPRLSMGLSMKLIAGTLLAAASASVAIFAAEDKHNLPEAKIQEIIQTFANKESEFSKIRESYTWRQSAKLQEFAVEGPSGGKWEMIWDVLFTKEGKRTESVIKAPVTTLHMIQMDPGDEQDLRSTQPFVLTATELPNYNVRYLGHEMVDEIGCYVFAVRAKKMEPGKRYFQGEVFVDDRDLLIVKSYGRGTGVRKKGVDFRYPKFETYREQIDGKYWFPTYTIANDVLQFENSQAVRVKLTSRYDNYKRFQAESTIKFGDEANGPGAAPPASAKPDLAPPLAPDKAPTKATDPKKKK